MKQIHVTATEEQTRAVACDFAAQLRRGEAVCLYGELGSGKTQFVKGVCRALGVKEPVTSPTFVLLNRYDGRDRASRELLVYHFDLYRMKSVEEIYDLGYEEVLESDGVSLIEWADALGPLLPAQRYDVRLAMGGAETERRIEIEAVGESAPANTAPDKSDAR